MADAQNNTSEADEPEVAEPVTTLTVPVRPVAATGANLITLAGTAAVAGGPAGIAAAVVGAAAIPATYAAVKVARRRAERRAAAARAAAGGRATGAGRHGAGRPGTGRPGSGLMRRLGMAPGRGSGSGRLGRLLGRQGGGRGSGSGAGRQGRGLGGSRWGSGTGAGRLGRAMRSGGRGVAAGTRAAWRGIGRVAQGAAKKFGGGGGWLWRRALDATRGAFGFKLPDLPPAGRLVKPTVNRGPTPDLNAPKLSSRSLLGNVVPVQPVGLPVTPSTGKGGSGMGFLRDTASQMWAATSAWSPRSMGEVVVEFDDLPDAVACMRATLGTLEEKARKQMPLDPAVAKALANGVQALAALEQSIGRVPETLRTIHKPELDRLGPNRRTNEDWWDASRNPGVVS